MNILSVGFALVMPTDPVGVSTVCVDAIPQEAASDGVCSPGHYNKLCSVTLLLCCDSLLVGCLLTLPCTCIHFVFEKHLTFAVC